MSIFKLNNLIDDEMREVFDIMFKQNDVETVKKNWKKDRDLTKADITVLEDGKNQLLDLETEFYGINQENNTDNNSKPQEANNKHKIVHINSFDWAKRKENHLKHADEKNEKIISNDEEDLER